MARTMTDEQEAALRANTTTGGPFDVHSASVMAWRNVWGLVDEARAELGRVRVHHAADECYACGTEACVGNEPLHFHHDGCPYEYGLEQDNAALKARLALAEGLERALGIWHARAHYCVECGTDSGTHTPGCSIGDALEKWGGREVRRALRTGARSGGEV